MFHLQNTTARQNNVASFSGEKRQRFNTAIPEVITLTVMYDNNNIGISLVQIQETKPLPSPGQTTRGQETPFVSSFELFK